MSQDLFRKEVLDAKRSSWLGAISLAQPINIWLLTGAAIVAASCVALFLVCASYARRSTVVGQLVPAQGLATVVAPAAGVVSSLPHHEGDRVSAGQALAAITQPYATAANGNTVDAVEQRLQQRHEGLDSGYQAQQQLLSAQADGLVRQLANARTELAQIEREIQTRNGQIAIANESVGRLRELQNDRYVSALQIRQQEAAALEHVSAMQALQRQAINTRRTIVQLQQALRELPGQRIANDAAYRRDVASIEQEKVETEARGSVLINAPVGGLIASQTVKAGQAVQAGQPLLSVIPGDGRLEAELLVPSRAIGFIAPGNTVLLRYQAYPYQKFGHQLGRVATISRSALTPAELGTLLGSTRQTEPFYRVTVALDRQDVRAYGKPERLKPGMLVDADILGERRRLIEWIFEPLYSVTGRLAAE